MDPIGWVLVGALAALTLMLAYRSARHGDVLALLQASLHPAASGALELNRRPDHPVSFGPRMMWLAVRAESPAQVAAQLYIQNIAYANWASGIASAYDHGMRSGSVFLSPVVDGWVLVVGGLPDPAAADGDAPLTRLLRSLSRRFGEVQYFGTHGVAQWHAWAKWIDGVAVRAFACHGPQRDTLWSFGVPTPQEQALGLPDPDDAPTPNMPGVGPRPITEIDVARLAGAWSIDPTRLDTHGRPRALGLYAEIVDSGP